MNVRGLVAALFILAVAPAAHGQVVIRYDTEGVGGGPPTPTVSSVAAIDPAAGVTGVNVVRGSGLTPVSAGFAINSSGWNDLSPNDYYQFGFNTTIPYDVDDLTIGLRSSNTGPGFVKLLYSRDGGAYTLLTSTQLVGTAFNNFTADLSAIGIVHNSLFFRIVAANTTSAAGGTVGSAGTLRIASFQPAGTNLFVNPAITGAAVPEPGAAALLGSLLVPVAAYIRRRK